MVEYRGWWTPSLFTAGIASVKFFLQHVLRQNTLTQARRNISRHYDLVWDHNLLILWFNNVHAVGKIDCVEIVACASAMFRILMLVKDLSVRLTSLPFHFVLLE